MAFFFTATRRAHEQITDLFSFVWPTAAAMWNLRWQVNGYLAVRPDASNQELAGRFVAGSQIHGSDLRRTCVETTWTDQQRQFAKFILLDLCALYESWAAAIASRAAGTPAKRATEQLQFASDHVKGGVLEAIATLTAQKSTVMEAAEVTSRGV